MLFPAPEQRTPEQQAVIQEVAIEYEEALQRFFERLDTKARAEGWSDELVRDALDHHADLGDEWEEWSGS